MFRRVYLVLIFVRIYFALCPSYLHPDENFQGPEVIAASIFDFPSRRTWEWTVAKPVRSVFPLWPAYGLPMVLLQWLWPHGNEEYVSPKVIYYTLRLVMFAFSFVLEDWAIHELVHSPRYRRQAMLLVASSYVTWTYQTHTFSNSIETLIVLWSLVLIERIIHEEKRSSLGSSFVLGFLLVFGTFNRITFPAFVLIPGIPLLPHFWNKPYCLLTILFSGAFWTLVAVATDTAFYTGPAATESFRHLFEYLRSTPVITPLNNLLYNTQTSNLAQHGLHPHYQHIVANLPQLLGPALLLLIPTSRAALTGSNLRSSFKNPRLTSAVSATIILSIVPHQEARFLIPCVPLFLTCIRMPNHYSRLIPIFWTTWAIFNVLLAVLMGIYHQAGIIPAQLSLPKLVPPLLNTTSSSAHNIEVFYWKTYPPPTYLLGSPLAVHPKTNKPLNISTVPLMGIPQSELVFMLMQHVPTCDPSLLDFLTPHTSKTEVLVVAPLSAWRLPSYPQDPQDFSFSVAFTQPKAILGMKNIATFRKHINLDDLDFGDDGVAETLKRVVGRRGLGIWKVERVCEVEALDGEGGKINIVAESLGFDGPDVADNGGETRGEDDQRRKDELK